MYFNKRGKGEKKEDDGVEVDRGIILPMFQGMYHKRRSTQHEMQNDILRREDRKIKEGMKERDERIGIEVQFFQCFEECT